jgi:hypothetical protein
VSRKQLIGRILIVLYVIFTLWFFMPILIELLAVPPKGDEVGLTTLICFLLINAFLSLGLWKNRETINTSKLFRWITSLQISLLAILISLFTYSSWILLVATIAIFYLWLKKLVQGKTTIRQNLSWTSLFSFGLSIYVLIQLLP